ncbi:hypothetical protein BDD43_0822 [Mucilaginibacter gracilis]|uniref:Uncharacterized protein n=1 Tax=Mucilaginibacter gracilis TaxID=423350 RepID=A0A495IVE6_9SPHI|nr:hypothetical protein BDD43_0822 [Mucilaginibacter gracilis]
MLPQITLHPRPDQHIHDAGNSYGEDDDNYPDQSREQVVQAPQASPDQPFCFRPFHTPKKDLRTVATITRNTQLPNHAAATLDVSGSP